MYLSCVKVENFRALRDFEIKLNPGLNLIVGENNSGKSTFIDAVRFILGTRDNERLVLTRDDFHVDRTGERATELKIECRFDDLEDEEAAFCLEWLGIDDSHAGSPRFFLRLILEATRKERSEMMSRYDREVVTSLYAGPDSDGRPLEASIKDLLRATYLRPLRDAEQELAARRGSRLSQILYHHPDMRDQADEDHAGTLVQIMKDANQLVKEHNKISEQIDVLNRDYLSQFILQDDSLQAAVEISNRDLRSILESLALILTQENSDVLAQGLGMNNLLFMATELLLLQRGNTYPSLPLVLIEEPEAHLHPQLQLLLVEFLERQRPDSQRRQVQTILTSHSPNVASKVPLEQLTILNYGKAFPLAPEFTSLAAMDYSFLARFLDATNTNRI